MNAEDILVEALRYRISRRKNVNRDTIEEILDFDLSDIEESKVTKLRHDYNSLLNSTSSRRPSEDVILKSITDFLKNNNINEISDRDIVFLGRALANIAIAHDARNTEMRRFLNSTKKIRNNYANRRNDFKSVYLLPLKVNFDYFATRHMQLKKIVEIIDVFISRITENGKSGFDQFMKLDRLIEALIVYHKVYGGREK